MSQKYQIDDEDGLEDILGAVFPRWEWQVEALLPLLDAVLGMIVSSALGAYPLIGSHQDLPLAGPLATTFVAGGCRGKAARRVL